MAARKMIKIMLISGFIAMITAKKLASDLPEYFVGNKGLTRWKHNCENYGELVGIIEGTSSEGCRSKCIAKRKCNTFMYFFGVCFMKRVSNKDLARLDYDNSKNIGKYPDCGFIPSRY